MAHYDYYIKQKYTHNWEAEEGLLLSHPACVVFSSFFVTLSRKVYHYRFVFCVRPSKVLWSSSTFCEQKIFFKNLSLTRKKTSNWTVLFVPSFVFWLSLFADLNEEVKQSFPLVLFTLLHLQQWYQVSSSRSSSHASQHTHALCVYMRLEYCKRHCFSICASAFFSFEQTDFMSIVRVSLVLLTFSVILKRVIPTANKTLRSWLKCM